MRITIGETDLTDARMAEDELHVRATATAEVSRDDPRISFAGRLFELHEHPDAPGAQRDLLLYGNAFARKEKP